MKKQDFEADKIAKSQYGAICWPQVERLGFNRLQIKRKVKALDLDGPWTAPAARAQQ